MRRHDASSEPATRSRQAAANYRLAACAPQNVKERGGQAEVSLRYRLFPLNRARWFGRDIENDAIDTFNLVNDAIGDAG
jgi:hypothetical protein